jgi:predicted TIM-barrel fold metal-dependent hydrolase
VGADHGVVGHPHRFARPGHVLLPGLLYERLDELGIDFTILYPSLGLTLSSIPDDEIRQVACHVYNTMNAELYRDYSDRITPVAMIPATTPEEAIAELEHAVLDLGLKAIVTGFVRRPIPKVAREWPDAAPFAQRLETFGIDSEYDYDPFWQRCVDLGVAVGLHSSEQGWGSRRSISRYTYNHIGCFGAAGDSLAKSLFMGGVTNRFPSLNFVFLEGGVGWACSLLSDLVGHWEKRNRDAILDLDPAKLDVEEMERLFRQYAPDRYQRDLPAVRSFFERPAHRPAELDDWRACGIDKVEDIKRLFVDPFYFGCEADDPINAWAFNTKVNPFGAKLKAVFGSDLGHWDVEDLSRVVCEAYELVEHDLVSTDDFRDFMFTNPTQLYTQSNPDFFKGTRCEAAVAELPAAGPQQ